MFRNNQKKRRVGKACDSCRMKKTKCDGAKPCNKCRADNKLCTYTEKKQKLERTYSSSYVELLHHRVDLLQSSLQSLLTHIANGDELKQYLSDDGEFNINELATKLLGEDYVPGDHYDEHEHEHDHSDSDHDHSDHEHNSDLEPTSDHEMNDAATLQKLPAAFTPVSPVKREVPDDFGTVGLQPASISSSDSSEQIDMSPHSQAGFYGVETTAVSPISVDSFAANMISPVSNEKPRMQEPIFFDPQSFNLDSTEQLSMIESIDPAQFHADFRYDSGQMDSTPFLKW